MEVKKALEVILASGSPRRKELLHQIGIEYRCIVSTKEEVITTELPVEVVKELSGQKALDVYGKLCEEQEGVQAPRLFYAPKIIIGADTVVSYGGKILGKPKDEEDAFRMLSLLSGNDHEVYTGVTVLYLSGREKNPVQKLQFAECTKVHVAVLSEKDIREYIATGEPSDKAGAYGIQGLFGKYVTGISGDYHNVVGLPVARLFQEVKNRWGIDLCTSVIQNRQKIKACIFDLDGTTLDTIISIGTTVNMVLEELGLGIHSMEEYKSFAGDGQFELIRRSLRASGDTELLHYEQAIKRYTELFKERCHYQVKPFEGIRELFASLRADGKKIAIFSNKRQENVESILKKQFEAGYFDAVLGQRDDYRKKPSAEGIDIILSALGVEEKDCLYIGDTNTDMMTGKNAGLYTIGVLWGFRSEEELVKAGADYLVSEPKEIMDLLG